MQQNEVEHKFINLVAKLTTFTLALLNYYLFTATVKHLQSLSSPQLKLWLAVKAIGTVLCAASKLRSVLHTTVTNPSKLLLS